jgi:hypothetical protein
MLASNASVFGVVRSSRKSLARHGTMSARTPTCLRSRHAPHVAKAEAVDFEDPTPSHQSYGPRTRREVLRLLGTAH